MDTRFQVISKLYTATDKRIQNGTAKYWKPVPIFWNVGTVYTNKQDSLIKNNF